MMAGEVGLKRFLHKPDQVLLSSFVASSPRLLFMAIVVLVVANGIEEHLFNRYDPSFVCGRGVRKSAEKDRLPVVSCIW